MKTISTLIILVFSFAVSYGQKDVTEVRIKTSAQCKECKERIEHTLAYEKGVKEFELDLETKDAIIKYKTGKTTPDKLRLAISKTGYDADEIKADKKAYENLPDCCKKPEDREFDHSGHDH